MCSASGGDDHAGQVGNCVQQRLEAGDFVRFLADVQLRQDQAGRMFQRGEQVDLPAAGLGRAPKALAVHGQAPKSRTSGRLGAAVGQPAADRPVQRVTVDTRKQPTHRGLRGHKTARQQWIGANPELFQHMGRCVGNPLTNRQQRRHPASTAHAANANTAARA
ncbi:hypothetical protein ACGFX8_35490 [Streptomyces sp. NPDC048362]|uniref:hypothetical protein n=1 Tax=Streptomyces sp. NPDC048362 TaxID=3365539 RepID=UPI00371F14DB